MNFSNSAVISRRCSTLNFCKSFLQVMTRVQCRNSGTSIASTDVSNSCIEYSAGTIFQTEQITTYIWLWHFLLKRISWMAFLTVTYITWHVLVFCVMRDWTLLQSEAKYHSGTGWVWFHCINAGDSLPQWLMFHGETRTHVCYRTSPEDPEEEKFDKTQETRSPFRQWEI